MNESEKRLEASELAIDAHELDDDELAELDQPGTEYHRNVDVSDDNPGPALEEVEETEVTPDNYEQFLPHYTDENPPHINVLALQNGGELLKPDGTLTDAAQAEYDEDPPDPQESFEDSEGV